MADLTEKENARLRKALQDAIDSGRFKNKTALAREMKIAQPSLTEIMLGGGASLATARKAAKVLGAAFYEAPGVARETVADEDAVIDPRILEDSERAADYLGAALMAPYPLARAYDDDWRALAGDIGSTQTQAALRCAEVLHLPRAVVTPARVYLRGPEGFVWPLARRKLERLPGVRKTPLDDDPARAVLDVEEVS